MSKIEMEIEKANRTKKGVESKGWKLFGFKDENYGWFERWYPSREKAESFAAKKGWPVIN